MKEKLDIIFSKYIRLRDTNEDGYGTCCTCGKTFHYRDLGCGHFRKRRHLSVRWDEENAHIQCTPCNTEDDMAAYMIFMLNEYGVEVAQRIIDRSQARADYVKQDYEEMYQYFRGKVKKLLKDKMFTIKY